MIKNFYKGKRVFITGHTGFKGSWLSTLLVNMGAEVVGYSTCSKTDIRLFDLCEIKNQITHIKGDVRDFDFLNETILQNKPEIIIHMAAQPIVQEGYANPLLTYSTNVMGTVNILEVLRLSDCVHSFLNVTTDKVYENKEWEWGYRENDTIDGYDPYSNSKSCSELVTHSYKRSFFNNAKIAVSTARAGNVIGGGDFAKYRIIPDCVRYALKGQDIIVRNPYSIRPYQHVLEPLYVYLLIAAKQYNDIKYAGSYNIGADDQDCINTGKLVSLFCQEWGEELKWVSNSDSCAPHEANFLKLDCSKIKSTFNWHSKWSIEKAVKKTVEWCKAWKDGKNVRAVMDEQIQEFLS